MKRRWHIPQRQTGFALVAAIFLLVVIAALGAFAVRTSMSQQAAVDLALLSARAQATVEAGAEVAAASLSPVPRNCNNLPAGPIAAADGFTISFGPCTQRSDVDGASTIDTFTVSIDASHGMYGSADFVSRSTVVRISF